MNGNSDDSWESTILTILHVVLQAVAQTISFMLVKSIKQFFKSPDSLGGGAVLPSLARMQARSWAGAEFSSWFSPVHAPAGSQIGV